MKLRGAPFMFNGAVYSLRPYSSMYYPCPKRTEIWRNSTRCFVRFGELPPNGLSWNCLLKEFEAGVSVWRGRRIGDRVIAVLPNTRTEIYGVQPSALLDFFHMWVDNSPVFVVRGKLLRKIGGVGEPLLADIHSIEKARYEGCRI